MAGQSHHPKTALQAAWWALLLCVLVTTTAVRLRLLDLPLERDEGEYAYAGQLMLSGIPPYQFAYSVKFPGTYAAYALIMASCGETIRGIHFGLLLVNGATIAIVFLLGRRLYNPVAGIAAASAYAVFSISLWVAGLSAHATHFAMLPVLGGALLLLGKPERIRELAASAILFGIGLLMKQPALTFVFFGAGYLFYDDVRMRRPGKQIALRSAVFLCSAAIPLALTCALLWRAGVFATFWFWTIDYAREYGSLISPLDALRTAGPRIVQAIGPGWPGWLIAALGLTSCVWDARARAHAFFLLGFLVCSAASLCAGFYFREHYFIFFLPALSLLAGVAAASLTDAGKARRSVQLAVLAVFCAGLSWPLLKDRDLLFDLAPKALCRSLYSPNPFPESLRVAEYIDRHTNSQDRVAILGSEPQILFYAHRLSATGYIYTYGLMEKQKYAGRMQREMMSEIERNHPKYLVLVAINDSWLRRSNSETRIFTWANEYCSTHYVPAGLINIVSPDRTDYFFDTIPGSVAKLENYILIYQLKPVAGETP